MAVAVDRSTTENSSFLYVIAGVTAIAGFLYGYDTGIISGALLPISSEFHLGHRMQEIVASAILVGAVIGALSCETISERLVQAHRGGRGLRPESTLPSFELGMDLGVNTLEMDIDVITDKASGYITCPALICRRH